MSNTTREDWFTLYLKALLGLMAAAVVLGLPLLVWTERHEFKPAALVGLFILWTAMIAFGAKTYQDLKEDSGTLSLAAMASPLVRPTAITLEPFCIVFSGPPSAEGPTFIEVEDGNGRGLKRGEWKRREDGYWTLGPFVEAPQPKEAS